MTKKKPQHVMAEKRARRYERYAALKAAHNWTVTLADGRKVEMLGSIIYNYDTKTRVKYYVPKEAVQETIVNTGLSEESVQSCDEV